MADDNIKRLEMRITELENLLKQRQPAAMPEVSADEFKAFLKVGGVLAAFDDGGSCGINECQQLRPRLPRGGWRIPRPRFCDVECICGPCNLGNFGGGRFGGFGD